MAQRALEIIAEARAAIAAGRDPDVPALQARIREAGGGDDALQQLERVLSIHRARARLARPPAAPPASRVAVTPLRAELRTRPTISANMDVRRRADGGRLGLEWDAAPAVAGWEVRFSERPDARGEYVVREELSLPGGATGVDVPLGELPLRVHVLGRSRDGRLVRRAVVSGLTRAGWNERWLRRASAS
jgi:hypothetical protein